MRALPAFQALADKYRNDPDVSIVSIDTWDPPARLKRLLEKNTHDLWVLLDNGYAGDAGVIAVPTTWFLDRAGRLQYRLVGNEEDLLEQDSWLIEELKRR